MVPSRPLARLTVVLPAALAVLGLSLAVPWPASAHVTVFSDDAAAGGYGKFTFRVPNESDTASTVALRVQLPAEAPLSSLLAQPVPGWTVTTTSADLDRPVEVGGQEVSSYVSVVEFRAVDGGGIRPGEFQEFSLSGGPIPEVDRIVLPAVQSYSDGTEAAWIEPTVDGQPEPEKPAPVLTLSGASVAGGGTSGSDGGGGAEPAGDAATAEGHGSGESTSAATSTRILAVLGLLAGVAGAGLGWLGYRRTVSS